MDRLTQSLLFDLFCHQGNCQYKLHHHFCNNFGYRPCMRDIGINIETVHGLFNRFEKVNEDKIIGTGVLGQLMNLNVRWV